MAGPLQGPAAAASGAGGAGSLDRTPYSTGRGTGGKARSSRPGRNQHGAVGVASSGVGAAATTRRGPYDRPTAGRHASAGPQAAARRSGRVDPGAWIGAGAVGSAASKILSGASSFLSSFFRKNSQNLALPAPPAAEPLEGGTTQSFQDGFVNDCSVLVHVEEKAVEDVDIEDILQERVFSREECDHFIKLLQSKLHNNAQPLNRIANGLKEDRDRRSYPDDELQREGERHGPGLAQMPIEETAVDHGGSPVDIAKAYMDKRLSSMPGSALPVRTLDYWDAVRGREEVRATPSRVGLEATPGRTPYVRQRQARPYDEGVRPSPYPVRGTGGREKKRRVDDEWDYSGRRTRRKTSAANGPPVSTLPDAPDDLGNGGYFERMKNLQKARLERSHKPDTTVHVPMQSTETARKILQTLEILTPPKGKTLKQELALVREMRPRELSPSMLNEQARKSMQVVECPVAQTSTDPCSAGAHVAEPSSSEVLLTSSRQPITNDTKGKGVSACLEGGLSAFEHHAGTSQSPPSKGFRINAAMEDSNSDDEDHPQTSSPLSTVTSTAVRVDAISVTKVDISSAASQVTTANHGSTSEPVSLSSKFGFTFPSAGGLFEPPTPKPIPSPMAQTGVDSASGTRTVPTMQGYVDLQNPTANDASKTETQPSVQEVPAAFSQPPSSSEAAVSSHSYATLVQSGSVPDFSASNGSSTTSHGSSVVAAISTSQTKTLFKFGTDAPNEVERISKKRISNVDDGNIVQSSEHASGSIFGISRSTSSVPIDTNLGPSNGTFHLPGGEASKFGFGNSLSVPSSNSAPLSSSPLGTSSSVGLDVFGGTAAQANGGSSNPSFGGLPLSASGSGFTFGSTPFGTTSVAEFSAGEIKPAFTFGSTSSTSVTESKPTILSGGTSSTSSISVTESKPTISSGGTSSTTATENKPAFLFGGTSSTSATESKPAFAFGATSSSSVPESKPAFTFGSKTKSMFPLGAMPTVSFSVASVSSTSSMFGTSSSSTFGAPGSSASGSTSAFAFSTSTSQPAAPSNSTSGVAPFSFPATTSASMAPFSFGQPAVSSSFPSASFSFGASTPSTSGSVFSAATGSSFGSGAINPFPASSSFPSASFSFGASTPSTSGSVFSAATGSSFGSGAIAPFPSASFSFGASTPSTSGSVFSAATASSFGSGAINPFPVFNSSPGFGSTNNVSTSDMNEHSMEDMAEEPSQVMQPPPSQPPPVFGNSAAQPFVFGGQSPTAAPAFGSSQPAVGSQPANPFSGFSAGSFAVGSGGAGGEKAGRKFIKAKRTGASKR